MRSALARALALCALVAVLDDGAACLVALIRAPAPEAAQDLAWRAPCPCGCAQHTATLIGVGLAQPAAPQTAEAVPAPERGPAPLAAPLRLATAPPRAVDHVPIPLA
jgi:hypothetical protein